MNAEELLQFLLKLRKSGVKLNEITVCAQGFPISSLDKEMQDFTVEAAEIEASELILMG